MNYWGFAFIGMVILAFAFMCLTLWLEERVTEPDQQVVAELQDEIDKEYLARLMSATGSIRGETKNVADLEEYRRKKATECSMR